MDAFRYYAFTHAIAKKSVKDSFNLATLPPTSAAAKQHILRTYLQVQKWIGNELEPTDWGWRVYMDTHPGAHWSTTSTGASPKPCQLQV